MEEKNELVKTESSPLSLIGLAVESKLPIEYLEKLMGLKERFDAIEAKKEFFTGFSKFQGECPTLEKTKLVSFTNSTGRKTEYKYAPLGEVTMTIKSALKESNLSYRWEINDEAEKITCTCIVSHPSGHSEKTVMSALKDNSGNKNEIQSRGSTITYLQRYTLIAALGISTADEDVDEKDNANIVLPDASMEQYDWIDSLLGTSSIPEEKIQSVKLRVAKGMSVQEAQQCITWLKENQVDNISGGKNYSQTDIKNKLKKEA